jgi:S1-C subfamily serine protease
VNPYERDATVLHVASSFVFPQFFDKETGNGVFQGFFAVVTLLAATAVCGADDKPRLGVSIIDTSNQAGVIVTKIEDDSPAARLSRVGGGGKLKLEPQKHAITHVNGRHVPTTDRFLEAIAASPKDCTLRIYEYSTADWADHQVQLRGEPTVAENQTDGEPRAIA